MALLLAAIAFVSIVCGKKEEEPEPEPESEPEPDSD